MRALKGAFLFTLPPFQFSRFYRAYRRYAKSMTILAMHLLPNYINPFPLGDALEDILLLSRLTFTDSIWERKDIAHWNPPNPNWGVSLIDGGTLSTIAGVC